MLTIMQFFGWRANTVVTLISADCVVAGDVIRIQTSAFKTLGPGGLPTGTLHLSKLPALFAIVVHYVRGQTGSLLFPGQGGLKPCEVCQGALRRVCAMQHHVPPLW